MFIKLLGRFSKENAIADSIEIEEELKTQQLIRGDNFDIELERMKMSSKKKLYEYVPVVFDIKDTMLYNAVDRNHTNVKLYTGISYTFSISFDSFISLHQDALGIAVYDCTTQPPLIKFTKP